MTAQNLQFLSVEQALEDLANFITTIKSTRAELENAKVIIVGGSYSGGLVTWFRTRYPNLVDGAYSLSGAVQAKVEYNGKNQQGSFLIHSTRHSASKTLFLIVQSRYLVKCTQI